VRSGCARSSRDARTLVERGSFFAYSPAFTGRLRVAAGDVNGDGVADIITAAGPGGGPHVKIFDGVTFAEIGSFFAYAPSFTAGVYVAATPR
jgi:FG-GAP repeat protein